METSYIRTISIFPDFSPNAANFGNSMGPGPIPKKGCESPGCSLITVLDTIEMELC